jgi:hypothetical protein
LCEGALVFALLLFNPFELVSVEKKTGAWVRSQSMVWILLKKLQWSKSNSRKHHQNGQAALQRSPITDPGTLST